MTTTTRTLAFALVGIAALLGGCGQRGESPVQMAQPSDETFKDFGNYEVHFNAVRTDTLTPEVARAYGIERSRNRVLLNVTMLRKDAEHAPRTPVSGKVDVDAYNLNGQLKNLEMRRVNEGDAIYYIGEVSISGDEILVFDIAVTPEGENNPMEVKFKREFFTD